MICGDDARRQAAIAAGMIAYSAMWSALRVRDDLGPDSVGQFDATHYVRRLRELQAPDWLVRAMRTIRIRRRQKITKPEIGGR
jgi:hypothetical protein